MAEVMPPVVQAQVVESQKIYPGQPGQVAVPVRGNAAARRQYMANRRGGDGSGRLRKVHQQIVFGIAVIIILLIVLLTVGGDGGNQGSGHNTPGYCKESATPCLETWTDSTQNGCSSPQEYCTNCDDSFYLCGNQTFG